MEYFHYYDVDFLNDPYLYKYILKKFVQKGFSFNIFSYMKLFNN